MSVIEGVKACRKCGQEKSLSEFNRDRRALDGKRTQCRECERGAAWRSRARQRPTDNEKNNARHALHRAVRDGLVVVPDRCAHCAKVGPVEGHHNDYSRPLEVSWLCRGCHQYLETLESENHRLRLQLAQTERERDNARSWVLVEHDRAEAAERERDKLVRTRDARIDALHDRAEAAEARVQKLEAAIRHELGVTRGEDTIRRLRAALGES